MFKDNSKRSKTKPFKQRFTDSGYDHRYIREGLIRERPDGVVVIDSRILSMVPHADLAWNVITGEAKEYVGRMSELLPDDYWEALDYVLKNYDRFVRRHGTQQSKPEPLVRPGPTARKQAIKTMKEEPAMPEKETPPEPLPQEEVEWVLQAVRRQHAGTTPEPGTAKVDDKGKTKIRRGSSEKVFGAILNHEGGAVTVDQLVIDTGLTRQQVHNGCHYLVGKGIVIRLMSGIYQIHPDAVKLSERVNVDVRHHDVTIASGKSVATPPEAPQAAQTAPNGSSAVQVPPAAHRPAQDHTATNGDDDMPLIESVLDLLRPDGFKARHLTAVAAWVEATKELLRVTDG